MTRPSPAGPPDADRTARTSGSRRSVRARRSRLTAPPAGPNGRGEPGHPGFVAPYAIDELAPVDLRNADHYDRNDIVVLTTDDVATVRTWRRRSWAALVTLTPPDASAAVRAALLDAGADLCLTDPTANELAAHLRALQRRLQHVRRKESGGQAIAGQTDPPLR